MLRIKNQVVGTDAVVLFERTESEVCVKLTIKNATGGGILSISTEDTTVVTDILPVSAGSEIVLENVNQPIYAKSAGTSNLTLIYNYYLNG